MAGPWSSNWILAHFPKRKHLEILNPLVQSHQTLTVRSPPTAKKIEAHPLDSWIKGPPVKNWRHALGMKTWGSPKGIYDRYHIFRALRSDSLYDKSFIPMMLFPKFKKDSWSFIKPNKVCSSTTGYVVHPKVFLKYLKAPPPHRRLIQSRRTLLLITCRPSTMCIKNLSSFTLGKACLRASPNLWAYTLRLLPSKVQPSY